MKDLLLLASAILFLACQSKPKEEKVGQISTGQIVSQELSVTPGAEQLASYVPQLKDKRVAVVVNQSSLVRSHHLVDTLLQLEIDLQKIFVPEHGFRGDADNGAIIRDDVDASSGLPIVSLYGNRKKPHTEDLESIDIVVFDLQDVGVRCYTYVSTLHYVMEACAELGIKILVLDRPNPNGHYVDGPVLRPDFVSFVGMHEIPFVHGMTIGEYAQMIKGESWINAAGDLDLEVIPCHGYTHDSRYPLPVPPSPNLPTYRSVLLYPSLVFFEGTNVSVGRGTETPFEIYGYPGWENVPFSFMPSPRRGASKPKHEGETCKGHDLSGLDSYQIRQWGRINLDYFF